MTHRDSSNVNCTFSVRNIDKVIGYGLLKVPVIYHEYDSLVRKADNNRWHYNNDEVDETSFS